MTITRTFENKTLLTQVYHGHLGNPIILEPGQSYTEVIEGTIGNLIVTTPPAGKCRVTNIYVNPDTGKAVVEYDDALQP